MSEDNQIYAYIQDKVTPTKGVYARVLVCLPAYAYAYACACVCVRSKLNKHKVISSEPMPAPMVSPQCHAADRAEACRTTLDHEMLPPQA